MGCSALLQATSRPRDQPASPALAGLASLPLSHLGNHCPPCYSLRLNDYSLTWLSISEPQFPYLQNRSNSVHRAFVMKNKIIALSSLHDEQHVVDAVVQLLSRVRLFATPWTAARQASLSLTISRSLPKFMSLASVMPSSHLNLMPSSPSALNLSQHQGLFR